MMKRILIAIEKFLADQSIDARYPYNLYSLKAQVRLKNAFPKTFKK